MIALPDVNVLLALVWSHHPHHEAAHRWFAQAAAEGWATCLLTQTGLLRLSLNPQIVGVAIDGQAAMQLLQQLVAHPQHHYVDQAPALTATDFEVLIPKIRGYRQMTDATLLYLAYRSDMKLVTFDRPVVTLCPWPDHVEHLIP